MKIERGQVDAIWDRLNAKCVAEELQGVGMAINNRKDPGNPLNGKGFYFIPVNNPQSGKSIFISEIDIRTLAEEDALPQVLAYEDPDEVGMLYMPFPNNYLSADQITTLIFGLGSYLAGEIPPKQVVERKLSDFLPCAQLPLSNTIH